VRKGQLGGRYRVTGRGIHHDNAPVGRRLDIDIINAYARAPHDLEQRRSGNHLGSNLRLAANNDRVHVSHETEDLLRRRAVSLNDIQTRLLAQVFHSLGRDFIGDEDFHQ